MSRRKDSNFGPRYDVVATRRVVAHSRRICNHVLAQVLLVALPTSALLAAGKASWAGLFCWALFGVLLLRLAWLGKRHEILCLLIALTPLIDLLRRFASYSIIAVLLGGGLAYYYSRSPGTLLRTLRKYPMGKQLFVFVSLYYLFSLVITQQYAANLRLFELAFAVLIVLTIGRDRDILCAALLGMLISSWGVGIAMLQHINSLSAERLGMIEVEGHTLGNPASLGMPLALGFLALSIDQGRWLGMQSRPLLNCLLFIPTSALLALTTARVAWLIVAVGLVTSLFFGRRTGIRTLVILGSGALALMITLISPYASFLQKGVDRTFGDGRTVRQRSSGRSDQWIVTYHAVTQSAGSLLHGYGPGVGPAVYAKYSRMVEGIQYGVGREAALHSLFMQVAVETGLLGLVPLLVWFLVALLRIVRWMGRHGDLFPLVCFLGYLCICATVTGHGTVSGVFLGVGLLATLRRPHTFPDMAPGWVRRGEPQRFVPARYS